MNPFLTTRRDFLRTTLLGAATASSIPSFVSRTFAAEDAATRDLSTQFQTGKDGNILIILQLAGGNDGLNTLVPYADDAYHRARPSLAKDPKELLKINDQLGLNGSLSFLRSLYDEGDLGIVQGVGYPNPNRSHFRSTEIWECATDAEKTTATGWVGRFFDHACKGMDPTCGIALRASQPQSFTAIKQAGVALSAPELYRWIHGGDEIDTAEEIFDRINSPETPMEGASMTAVDGRHVGSIVGESNLDFLERVALDARVSSKEIIKIASKYRNKGVYENNPLARSLRLVSSMIAGGLPTRIYYVSHGGFDTHNQQAASHDRLLSQLDHALKAFFTDIRDQGNQSRISVMTFSEFGRRVAENQNKGTDHGAAAPLFVMGAPVKGGIYGKSPSLTDLDQGDLRFNTDFRSIYASTLEQFLKSPAIPILGKEFKQLPLFG